MRRAVRLFCSYVITGAAAACLAGCAFSVAPTSSEDRQVTLELLAIPNRTLVADTLATAEIWATLKRGPSPMRDSTTVVFATTVGSITPSSVSKDGLAVALLRVTFPPGETPPRGTVMAQALTVRDTLEVDFVSFGD